MTHCFLGTLLTSCLTVTLESVLRVLHQSAYIACILNRLLPHMSHAGYGHPLPPHAWHGCGLCHQQPKCSEPRNSSKSHMVTCYALHSHSLRTAQNQLWLNALPQTHVHKFQAHRHTSHLPNPMVRVPSSGIFLVYVCRAQPICSHWLSVGPQTHIHLCHNLIALVPSGSVSLRVSFPQVHPPGVRVPNKMHAFQVTHEGTCDSSSRALASAANSHQPSAALAGTHSCLAQLSGAGPLKWHKYSSTTTQVHS